MKTTLPLNKILILPIKSFFASIAVSIITLGWVTPSFAQGSNFYWVGGAGNWSDFANHWATSSGGTSFHTQIPSSLDNVYFDGNSFTGSGQTVTPDVTIEVNDFDWSGVTHSPTLLLPYQGNVNISGSLTLSSGMSISGGGSNILLNFISTSQGKTITTAGISIPARMNFNGLGGGWTFQDNLTLTSYGYIQFQNGSLNTNNKSIQAEHFILYGSGSATLGSSVMNLSGSFQSDNTNMTLDVGSSVITCQNFSASGPGGLTFSAITANSFYGQGNTVSNLTLTTYYGNPGVLGGNNTIGTLNFQGNAGINGSNTIGNLTLLPGFTYIFQSGTTQTVNSLAATGTCTQVINLQSSSPGSQATISQSSGNVAMSYVNLSGIAATGGATFTAINCIDEGNNTGITITPLTGKNMYWVGGTGNWSDGSHWSLSSGGTATGCAPTQLDNVYFDANSFTGSSQIVTIDVATAAMVNFDWSGVTHSPTLLLPYQGNVNISGSLTLSSGMSISGGGSNILLNFISTSQGKTITTAGISIPARMNFNGLGGGWTFQDNLTLTSYGYIQFQNGSLNTNNKSIQAEHFILYGSGSATLGSSVMNLSGSFQSDNTNMTLDVGSSVITCQNFSASGPGGLTFSAITANSFYGQGNTVSNLTLTTYYGNPGVLGGNNTIGTLNFQGNAGINGSNTIGNLTLLPGFTYIFQSGTTQTVNSLAATGTCTQVINLQSSSPGSQATISQSSGNVAMSYVNLSGIAATGGATFTAINCIDEGNNTGITITPLTGKNMYWVGGTGNWSDGSHWSLSSGGTATGCAPTQLDNVYFDANSFTGSSQIVTIDVATAAMVNFDWSGVTHSPTLLLPYQGNVNISGSLTLSSGMSISGGGSNILLNFISTSQGKTITTAGISIPARMNFNGLGGGWTFQDNLTLTSYGYIQFQNGSLNTNNKSIQAEHFILYGSGSATLGSSVMNLSGSFQSDNTNMTLDVGSSVITCQNFSASGPGGLTFSAITANSFYGQGNTVSNLTLTTYYGNPGVLGGNNTIGTLNFQGNAGINGSNTIGNLTLVQGAAYNFGSGTTQTITNTMNAVGVGGFPIEIHSNSPGSFATLVKASGSVCADYIRMSDIHVSGGAAFVAGNNSQDEGDNSGWIFTANTPDPTATITYSPSGNIVQGQALTFGANFTNGGTSQNYNWNVNGTSIQNGSSPTFQTSTLNNNDIVQCIFTSYYGTCSSRLVNSNSIQVAVRLFPIASPTDSLALVDIYNAMGGSSWADQTNWLSSNLGTWTGVTLDVNGRVVGLNLNSQGLTGNLPNSFTNLTTLQSLDLGNNSITHLCPNFVSLTSLTFIRIKNNLLNFDDLAPVIGMSGILYNKQKNFGAVTTRNIIVGGTVNLSDPLEGTSNVYQWAKDNVNVNGATSSTYQFSSAATAVDAGVYVLSVTSPLVPGMTITSNPVTVNVIPIPPASQTIYFSWPGKDGIFNDVPAGSYGGYWGDYDNDGDEDLLVNNANNLSRAADLYQNNGMGVFTRQTTGNVPSSSGRNFAWADMDNDGYLDIFSTYGFGTPPPSGIYKNNGNKTFTLVPTDTALFLGSLADVNNDGLLDIAAGQTNSAYNSPLAQNIGSDKFTVISNVFSSSTNWITLWADIDNDNDQDVLFVGDNVNSGRSTLYRNDGNGVFTRLGSSAISTDDLGNVRGGSCADIDNDGDMDFLVLSQNGGSSTFYFNDGHGNFTAQQDTEVFGVVVNGRASNFGDIDNDGDLDLVVNTSSPTQGTSLFLNNGNGTFTPVASSQQTFIPVSATNPGVALADCNNDGFLDLFAATYDVNQNSAVYHGVKNANNWVKFKLQGTVTNKAAIGAKVRIKSGGKWQMREISSQTGLQSQNSLIVHFGVGAATIVDSVIVQWPSGVRQKLANQAVKQKHTVIETNPAPEYVTSPANGAINANVSLKITSSMLAGATTYTIEISPDNSFATGVISFAGTNSLNFSGLGYNTKYYARVKTNLSSFYGKTTSFTTAAPEYFAYVTMPANNATNVSVSPKVTSNTVIGATLYTIDISTDNTFSTGAISLSGAQSQTFSGLPYGTKYYARVKTNLSQNYGKITSFNTLPITNLYYITAPANNATNVPYVTNVTAYAVPTATQYTIELNTDQTFANQATSIVKTSSSKTIGFTLSNDTKYYARVTTDVNTAWGTTIKSFTTGDPLRLAYVTSPKNLGTGVPTTVMVYSNPVPTATSYTIELNTDPLFQTGISVVKTATMRNISFSGLAQNQIYYTRVHTNLDGVQWGITNTSFTTVCPSCRSGNDWVGDISDEETVEFGAIEASVYPIPFRDKLNIHVQTDQQEEMSVQLYDLSGSDAGRFTGMTNNKIELSPNNLSSGMYIIKIVTSKKVFVKKVIKE